MQRFDGLNHEQPLFDLVGCGTAVRRSKQIAGSRRIEALPNARPVREADGGTAYVLFRKDRFVCTAGAPLLKPYKISESSATSRVVATCCNAPMFLGFDDARHWVSAYRASFREAIPPLQMHICTKFRPANTEPPPLT